MPLFPAHAFRRSKAVAETPELKRIRSLPRRSWASSELDALALQLTDLLRTPTGTMQLRPVQALALHDIGTERGLFGPIRVGGGKTLTSLLAPYMLEAKRPLLILPAALVEKTERERRTLATHWKIPRNIRIISYEMLGRVQSAEELTYYRPDLIIADECHRLKNKKAGVTRRVIRYMRENPATHFVAISGTVMGGGKGSLRDYAHILRWCLPHDCPVPDTDGEVEEWADALDDVSNPLQVMNPGALLSLGPITDTEDETKAARLAFQSRLRETAGVVATDGDGYQGSLYVRALRYSVNDATEANFQKLRTMWETPDGWPLSEAVQVWRHARELAVGLHYIWDPRPPQDWITARRNWAAFVRETLKRSRTLDTELQVANACKDGSLDRQAFDNWTAIRPIFTPTSKPLWHDDSALAICQAWMKNGPGIVWCEHTFFADELSRITGAPYFGAQGKDSRGNPIESADPKTAVIASIAANSTGRNLQMFSRNLLTSTPPGASGWEQLLGRTHRDGQTADTVECDVLVGCFEHVDGFAKALTGADMARDTLGQSQKLLLADVDMPSDTDIARERGFRWAKVAAKS